MTNKSTAIDVIREAIDERDAMERQYHDLAENLIYRGNSVSWWHSKAIAYRDAIDRVWEALRASGISSDGKKTCADGVRELAARLAEPERTVTLPPLPGGYAGAFGNIGGRYVELRVINEDKAIAWREQIIEALRAAGVDVA